MMIHVHVYKIAGKAEFDIETDDPITARSRALELVKPESCAFGESDCKLLALDVRDARKKTTCR